MSTATRLLAQPPTPSDLTIAICTIGRKGFLHTAIESLVRTTPPGVTFHVVLNCPDDPDLGTDIRNLLDRWDGPTALTELGERLTIAGSHNTALAACQTDFITFMGDDDLVLEPRVERILERFWETVPTPAVIGSYCRRVSGSYDSPRFSTNKDYGPTTVEEWRHVRDSGELIEIVFPSAVYRTELLQSINGFEERFGSAMDLATFTILGQHHPVLADPRRSFAHRIHDGSVTSSSAAQHAARLRYTEAAISALRANEPQPIWEDFIDQRASLAARATDHRKVLSATLFRQGGAAAASGNVLSGASKVVASAALSPSTFLRRSKSQVTSESGAQTVVTIVVAEGSEPHAPFYDALRIELGERDIELRLVIATTSDAAPVERSGPSWAEHRPFGQLSAVGKILARRPGFNIASGADLVIANSESEALSNRVMRIAKTTVGTDAALWVSGSVIPARAQDHPIHWVFASTDEIAREVVEAGWPAERTTTLSQSRDRDPNAVARAFADGICEATTAPRT